jgi:hypothetical protein
VPAAHARVQWINQLESRIEGIPKLQVMDRAFMCGDIVARVTDSVNSNTGTVTNMDIRVDVK